MVVEWGTEMVVVWVRLERKLEGFYRVLGALVDGKEEEEGC